MCRGLEGTGRRRGVDEVLELNLSDVGHSKVDNPWVDVGGLWMPVPTHNLSSDKSKRKLLANGFSSADYAEVEAKPHLKDDQSKHRLGKALLLLLLLWETVLRESYITLHEYSHPVTV